MVRTVEITIETNGQTDIRDITGNVAQSVTAAGLKEGLVTVFTPSSTSALTTIEFESGAVADLKSALDGVAPTECDYHHNLKWGDGNGFAHVRAALMGPSLTIPVVKGQLSLGTWQQIVFLDFDNRPRHRELVVQLLGE